MADQLKVGRITVTGHGVLHQRPELAALIGCICAEWAYIENSLGHYYALLMGFYIPKDHVYEPPIHPVALQVMDELQNNHAKINLAIKLAEWLIKDKNDLDETKAVLNKLRKAGGERNKIAHSVWGVCEEYQDALILMPTFGHSLIYRKTDFELILEKIRSASQELGQIHGKLYQSRKQQL